MERVVICQTEKPACDQLRNLPEEGEIGKKQLSVQQLLTHTVCELADLTSQFCLLESALA
ncbi:hypothetical protein P5673_030066 [Acropora cervicornis]|uniref:Uncharacterized protein n=1 Tax=Acropora cervicornis TaxID=6130 RepID=A0AAD9PUV0_ACRCE|nr:hypothetical protein P5673_030066 [Acropora cervicornis]